MTNTDEVTFRVSSNDADGILRELYQRNNYFFAAAIAGSDYRQLSDFCTQILWDHIMERKFDDAVGENRIYVLFKKYCQQNPDAAGDFLFAVLARYPATEEQLKQDVEQYISRAKTWLGRSSKVLSPENVESFRRPFMERTVKVIPIMERAAAEGGVKWAYNPKRKDPVHALVEHGNKL